MDDELVLEEHDDVLVVDGEAGQVVLTTREAQLLLPTFSAAMVSGCPSCASGIIAVLAFGDALNDAPPLDVTRELRILTEEAPTLHLYVVDDASGCEHRMWRDPGYDEWADIIDELDL